MSTKAELMGCEYETGLCEHYLPGDGKVVNGVMRYPGMGNSPTLGGRCLKDDRMISRMDKCSVSGKSAKKLTKVERFGCLQPQCEHYTKEGRSVPCCLLAGEFAAINALCECPKTKQQQVPSPSRANEKIIGCVGEDCENYAKGDGALSAACMLMPTGSGSLKVMRKCPELYPDRLYADQPQKAPQEKIAPPHPYRPTEEEVDRQRVEQFCSTCEDYDAEKDECASKVIACVKMPHYMVIRREIESYGCIQCKNYVEGKTSYDATCLKLKVTTYSGKRNGCIADFECPGREPLQHEAPQESAPMPPAPSTSPMKIMAFDVSTTITGWALREGNKITERGTIRAPKGSVEERKDYIRQQILHYCLNGQPLNVVMLERSFVAGSGNTTRLLCELQGIIKNICHRMEYPVIEPSPTTWRAICPGSGKCDKDAVVEYARLKKYTFESIDEAEAICMALSFGTELVKILDAEKEKKKNGKSKDKGKESGGNHGSNGGKRGRASAGTAIPACAAKAS